MASSFATPLPQSPRSEILEWRFPKPYHNFTLVGRSRAAWHTSFVVPQLNLLLDAGLVVNNIRPKHIFLTHGHSDHTLLAPAFLKRSDPPDIYCPAEMGGALDAFLDAKTMLNEGGGLWPPQSKSPYLKLPPMADPDPSSDDPSTETTPTTTTTKPLPRPATIHPFLQTHTTHPLSPGTTVPLTRLPPSQLYTATAFPCIHTIPCIGYLFSTTTPKLNPSFASLPPSELAALRAQGTPLTVPVTTPVFAFLGDTTPAVFSTAPLVDWLAGGLKVVITECSFLYEGHKTQAERTMHTHWEDLEGVVRRWPGTVFVLTHFSMRYSDGEVAGFFRGLEGGVPGNGVVWVDGVAGKEGVNKEEEEKWEEM
ncbi:beta-lactamase-like protein [Staphylotrichum tortipilum]|uniref:Beta-lactamase-like protein n=1 Tax=Staphylotrichum tortipilum TaxID=2831512 RepID=A0AAN6MEV7_9PEZI|nr:beta-lactamase-like protein [Staphylotrichum longicolle]